MRKWIAAGALAVAATALLAAGALGAFTRSESSAAPSGDAIAIKGDWKVTVKSADGRVLRVHKFHNEFNGASTVAAILAHTSTTGRYWMTLSSSSGSHACGVSSASSCFIFESDDPNAGVAGWFGNLTAVASNSQLVVTGEIEATRTGEFNHVRMLLSSCGGGATTPANCKPGAYGNFSARTLPSPISLVAGQQAIVTVTYTFSAA